MFMPLALQVAVLINTNISTILEMAIPEFSIDTRILIELILNRFFRTGTQNFLFAQYANSIHN